MLITYRNAGTNQKFAQLDRQSNVERNVILL